MSLVGVADQAIQKIKAMIISGELKPGARLPAEPTLAAQLGVSRSSLREAVRALALIQVLDVRHGDGTFVTSLEPGMLVESTGFIAELLGGGREVELFQVRRILEPAAAVLAVGRISDEAIGTLHRLVLQMEAATTVSELTQIDIEFHRTLTRAANNPFLSSLVDKLETETTRARQWNLITGEGVAEATKIEHRAIYEAVRVRDADLTRATVTTHIARGEIWLHRLVEREARRAPVGDGGPRAAT
jgi:GntR family transcriptional regulator, transcriptional repressor for pyruvate dehydrogenase complex